MRRLRPGDLRRGSSVLLFFGTTLVAPALLTAATTPDNAWIVFWWTIAAAMGLTVLGTWLVSAWELRRQRWDVFEIPAEHVRPCLLATVGLGYCQTPRTGGPSLAELQLTTVKPERIALVCSAATPDVRAEVEQLAQRLVTEGVLTGVPTVRVFVLDEPDDVRPAEHASALDWLAERNPDLRADAVADLTGGLTAMKLGAYIAASERGVDIQLVRQDGTRRPTLIRPR